ncbi:hypothetical protein NEMIN01_1759 [Nematocida minor]|uniref:uncharacterized protein n=1 Tax=Nematocida minor TaxID=1912983 RepID=UPI00221E8C86|nr:uncharacterized protein NEMIN01_1759 [Nematocida minor]KAI5191975.1 hypothetical protein NEMIN01_1759 [Nematocida minor]
MDTLRMLDRLSYHLAGPHRRAFYNTLCKCMEKEEIKQNGEHLARVQTMQMYCLAVDGLIEKASSIFNDDLKNRTELLEPYNIEQIMLKEALLMCNLLDRIDTSKLSEKERFEIFLISKNFDSCKTSAISLIKHHGKYAMILYLVQNDLMSCSISTLALLLNRITVTNSLISLLIRKGVPYSVVRKYIRPEKDAHFLLLMKTLLLAGESIVEYGYPSASALINELDDWEIYEYAMQSGIRIDAHCAESPVKNKIFLNKNFHIHQTKYAMITSPTAASIAAYINATSAVDAYTVTAMASLSEHDAKDLESHLSPGSQRMMSLYNGTPILSSDITSPGGLLLVIGLLLRNKSEESLLDALVLCYMHRDTGYYVRVVMCVLFRYFFMYSHLINNFSLLDAENIQVEGLGYLWSDLEVLLGLDPGIHAVSYMHTRSRAIADINNGFMKFIEAEAYSQIEPLLAYRDALIDSPIRKQIATRELQKSVSKPAIENILISEARHIFTKITSPPAEKECKLLTIQQKPKEIDAECIRAMGEAAIERVKKYTNTSTADRLISDLVEAQSAAYAAIAERYKECYSSKKS